MSTATWQQQAFQYFLEARTYYESVGWFIDWGAKPFPGVPRSCQYCDHTEIVYVVVPQCIAGKTHREAPFGLCTEHYNLIVSVRDRLGMRPRPPGSFMAWAPRYEYP